MDEKRITQVFLYYREKFGEIDKKISDLHKEKKKLNKDFYLSFHFNQATRSETEIQKIATAFSSAA